MGLFECDFKIRSRRKRSKTAVHAINIWNLLLVHILEIHIFKHIWEYIFLFFIVYVYLFFKVAFEMLLLVWLL